MDDPAREFANAKRGLVVAPAGCGKTHLITAATKLCKGRQLVLTHTHAGVKALKDRMERLQVPPSNYHVTTLDSLSLRFATAYPSVSGWTVSDPEKGQWAQLRPAARKVLQMQAMADVLQATYTGVFVDEYQDCGQEQHAMVCRLAETLPCRIVGDPLQAVFAGINGRNKEPLSWASVEKDFAKLSELKEPHRWKGANEQLGRWLLEIRARLLKNEPLDLAGLPFLNFRKTTPATARSIQIDACFALARQKGETVIGVRDRRPACHKLSGALGNVYAVFEDAEGTDLLAAAKAIDARTGLDRVGVLVETAQKWLTISSHNLDSLVASLTKDKPPAVKDPIVVAIYPLLAAVRDTPRLEPLLPAMRAMEQLPNATYRSREVWQGLLEGVAAASAKPGLTIRDAIWKRRDLMRRLGRPPPQRCLSTPLLVKGLECDHGIVLDTTELKEAEWLYVALTRASKSLTVLGAESVLTTKRRF